LVNKLINNGDSIHIVLFYNLKRNE